jgi:hypothetical protein
MDNNIPTDYHAPLKALKEVALELKLNQELDRLESFPENKSDLDMAQIEEILSIAEMIFDELKDYDSKEKNQNSDWARGVAAQIEPFIIRNKTKISANGGITYKQKKKLLKVRKKYDRLILTKSCTRAKNILMKDEGWTLGTLNKNLTKGKKLLQK